ncbi:MAG TPA: sugar phosphate nucleotidyltransferase [Candidatus Binataceae bacterium]|jgi:mannose-1-phosphate guanylyltransferase|nr:sugar phosphate nucleotidyltransferase [Candidatus Binataceae bacterium]
MDVIERQASRTAIVMAGGDGTRLRSLTRQIVGRETPKQFCVLTGTTTLLEQALGRAALMADRGLTLTVVNRAHHDFYFPLLSHLEPRSVVEQPANRDTAPAILYALLRLAETAPGASAVILPSDHFIDDEHAFARHVQAAFAAVEDRPELTVLLGIKASTPETSYGWITPGTRILRVNGSGLHAVTRFVEKPSLALAHRLMEQGSLWNTSVIVGRVSTLLGMFMVASPRLYFAFAKVRPTLNTVFEHRAVEDLYRDLAPINFSSHVLERAALNLAVMPVEGLHWSDLGETARVMEAIARTGMRPKWRVA